MGTGQAILWVSTGIFLYLLNRFSIVVFMKAHWCAALALAALFPVALVGCGDDNNLNPDATIMSVETAKEARKLFERYNGDYQAMSESDKKAYLDLFKGDQARADKTWEIMSSPPPGSAPGGSPTGTQVPAPGAGSR